MEVFPHPQRLERDILLNPDSVFEARGDAIENVFGSNYDDYIQGNYLSNLLLGRDGRDYLNGMEGDDILRGGRHRDCLEGAWFTSGLSGGEDMGKDFLYGDEGNDQILGGWADHLEGGVGLDEHRRGNSPSVFS